MHKKLKLGRLWLSPMEGVSDLGFRSMCAKRGANLTFIEMIRASALASKNKASFDLIDSYLPNIPTGLQLFATNPNVLKKALGIINDGINKKDGKFSNISVIDLNFGCPSKEILSIGG